MIDFKKRRAAGFTLIELLVVIAIIALLIGLLMPALAKARRNAASMKDQTQIKQVHQAMLIHANTNRERLPTPGLINRLPLPISASASKNVVGMGDENTQKNHTRHLYSAMIAQNYYNSDILIGPTEVNNFVKERQYDYDYYDPSTDIYWEGDVADPGAGGGGDGGTSQVGSVTDGAEVFNVQLQGTGGSVSNTSYAHMALVGQRKRIKWRNTQNTGDPILGTRGTGGGPGGWGGADSGDEYYRSPVLELHGAQQQWVGNVVFNDNHTEQLSTFYSPSTTYTRRTGNNVFPEIDNIYAAEFNDWTEVSPQAIDQRASLDAWLGIFTQNPGGVDGAKWQTEPIFDELY